MHVDAHLGGIRCEAHADTHQDDDRDENDASKDKTW